ncbi:cyclase family protein [Gordonia amarae]|uniref:Cyclase n=2 Tax=Gordonia amarae TaxID=36821 RepID=G7GNU6_9ACTN|nr:cyclase family protein [Gordonia amarae]MCS3878143.1 kynurenine formamidase [Gordonia amarae]QHN16813.1 cyclase family protein [Gordonia amarae]QHN21338.1 cyclase family protein [Gordonia amarae]QHN30193.1 cyclase family protein [Gordonia amarae]QHN38966.1 cyclase family protein [Gordonia amarae]
MSTEPQPIDGLPSYAELRTRTDAPAGSNWFLFGRDDQIGTLNLLRHNSLCEAAGEVRDGTAFHLDLPSDALTSSLAPTRKPAEHRIFSRTPYHHDEWLDGFYTQYGSQLDGLRHIAHPDHGFYNNADPRRFTTDDGLLGMANLAAVPIAGRAVLLDIGRYLEGTGAPLDHLSGPAVGVEVVEATAQAQGTEIRPGDILLLRFGWLDWYRNVASDQVREGLVTNQFHTGLRQSHEMVAWLWDHRVSLVAADNFALECWPAQPDSPFFTDPEIHGGHEDPHAGIMHRALIGLLGMPIGELWDIDALAAACAEDRRWSFLVTVAPMPLVGGVGSPANAIAIR